MPRWHRRCSIVIWVTADFSESMSRSCAPSRSDPGNPKRQTRIPARKAGIFLCVSCIHLKIGDGRHPVLQPLDRAAEGRQSMSEETNDSEATRAADEKLVLTPSRQFPNWLAEHGVSLAFTTYQAGKLFLIGTQADGRLSVFERTFNRCMGLWADGQTIWMSSLYQLWRMENVLPEGQQYQGYDRLYVPQVGYTTGDIDVHDVSVDEDGNPLFVSTLFGCLATVSDRHSFKPVWKPDFLSKLAAEDRCNLNGLAMRDGKPAHVTAVSRSDVADGWRDRRADGGILMDVGTQEVVVEGLSMPRENRTFSGLPLDDRLKAADAEPRCALQVIDLKTGDIVHWLRIEGVVQELYDVSILPGIRRPQAVGFLSDEIRRILTVDDQGWDVATGLSGKGQDDE